jgi:hypothetical protein
MADFTWKGYGWFRRNNTDSPGEPMYNGNWGALNVSDPDVNDYVTLSITNPGSNPAGAEMFTVDPGTQFGYGTYTVVVGTRLDTLPSGVVFGGLFTYEDQTLAGNVSVTNNEIDFNETSDWGEGTGVNTSHNYFTNVSSVKTGVDDPFATTADTVTTHVTKWESGRLTFDSYAGTGTGGTLLKHTVATSNIPVPTGKEFVDINLWVFAGAHNTPASTPATSVVVRDFTYAPLGSSSDTANKKFFFMR